MLERARFSLTRRKKVEGVQNAQTYFLVFAARKRSVGLENCCSGMFALPPLHRQLHRKPP